MLEDSGEVVRGWKTEEYIGISIVNLWSLVGEYERVVYRSKNRRLKWVCLEYVPREAPVGGGIVFRLRLFNPLTRMLLRWRRRRICKIEN
jgi:hypothetical protein